MTNLNYLNERICELTENELKQCFYEFEEYNKTGTLNNNSLIRTIRNEYSKKIGMEYWDASCSITCMEILYMIAKKHYCN